MLGQALREQVAIAGLIIGQVQPAHELARHARQCRFGRHQFLGTQQPVTHAAFTQHPHVLAGRLDLRFMPEKLQQTTLAILVANARIAAQRIDALAAVLGDTYHALLVDGIALGRAVVEHRHHEACHGRVALGLNLQRCMLLEHPLECLARDAGRRPGGGKPERHLTGIAVAGFHGGGLATIHHRDLVPLGRQVIGAGDPDDAATENEYLHGCLASVLNALKRSASIRRENQWNILY